MINYYVLNRYDEVIGEAPTLEGAKKVIAKLIAKRNKPFFDQSQDVTVDYKIETQEVPGEVVPVWFVLLKESEVTGDLMAPRLKDNPDAHLTWFEVGEEIPDVLNLYCTEKVFFSRVSLEDAFQRAEAEHIQYLESLYQSGGWY